MHAYTNLQYIQRDIHFGVNELMLAVWETPGMIFLDIDLSWTKYNLSMKIL